MAIKEESDELIDFLKSIIFFSSFISNFMIKYLKLS